jgi:hypothetical protein
MSFDEIVQLGKKQGYPVTLRRSVEICPLFLHSKLELSQNVAIKTLIKPKNHSTEIIMNSGISWWNMTFLTSC